MAKVYHPHSSTKATALQKQAAKQGKPDPKSAEMIQLQKVLKSSHAAAYAEFNAAMSSESVWFIFAGQRPVRSISHKLVP